jgi:hypothetical protein
MPHRVVIGVKGSHVSVHRHFLRLGLTFAFHQFTEGDCTAVSLCFSRPVTRAQLVAAAAPLHVQSEEATRKLIETMKAKPTCDLMRWDAKHKIPLQGPLKVFVTEGEPFALDLYLPPNTAGFANVYTVGPHSIIITDYKTALALRQVQAFQDRLVPEAKSICEWFDQADDETRYRTFSASWAVDPKWKRPPPNTAPQLGSSTSKLGSDTAPQLGSDTARLGSSTAPPLGTDTARLGSDTYASTAKLSNTYAGAAAKLSGAHTCAKAGYAEAGYAEAGYAKEGAKLTDAGDITELAIKAAEALLAFAAARPGTKRKCFDM